MVPTRKVAALVRQVIADLDGAAVGRVYCDEGGDEFWAHRRQPVVDLGLRWARALAARVPRGGHSLYVGAGVAELPVMLVETLDLERRVVACNLREQECSLINTVLEAHGLPLRIHHADASAMAQPSDHVAVVSVLSDPESYPTVSAVTYGRVHPALIDPTTLAVECQGVRRLVRAVLAPLVLPGVVTTTVEEVPWILEWAVGCRVRAEADGLMVETAIVGDPVGFVRLRLEPAAGP
jgi:hypothetical protein